MCGVSEQGGLCSGVRRECVKVCDVYVCVVYLNREDYVQVCGGCV